MNSRLGNKWAFHSVFGFSFWSTKLPKYKILCSHVCLLFLLSKARWARQKFKTETNLKKITQLKWPKYEKTKLRKWNEPNIKQNIFWQNVCYLVTLRLKIGKEINLELVIFQNLFSQTQASMANLVSNKAYRLKILDLIKEMTSSSA